MSNQERDLELIKQILLQVEEHPFQGGWIELDIPSYEKSQIYYHLY